MRIFKFGGASVKDADSVKNVAHVLQQEGTKNTLVVISAMGKMTNAFENIANSFYHKEVVLKENLDFVIEFHKAIINDLFEEKHQINNEIALLFVELSGFMATNKNSNYNFVYDQIVSFGELLSTKIVSAYLTEINLLNNWIDVRDLIKTDATYRDAKVNWELTEENIQHKIKANTLYITQGFLGGNSNNTTTLGREGSDYTAGIFAYCLNAESVTIWKDVDGVLNADPRVFKETQLLNQISYTEAIEMAFYGASVIHPKTLQPLEKKEIPLYVRSFINLKNKGTKVSKGVNLMPLTPCFVVKNDQILVSISANDFSFMVENNISYIFKKLHEHRLKVNLIQNSAISFSVCIEDKFSNFDSFYNELKNAFKITFHSEVTLYTIRHFNEKSVKNIEKNGKVLLKQINKETTQVVIK
ncbi:MULTISPECIES: aspartate kinase [Tenacibaculum]|uniref:aspartate kinase n=1 Tax=Tenacibaculum TaxID=104267 RepID=UPI001F0A3D8B|nr:MULTISPECIES: aspartate kinase [Tenacibaculum]MCH3881234.1 aspartate kinase [Tenacibaculum aquimarinum]MDO6599172.1 aspartate kinase [Tenacibaculum sp. 1_MG-2023]